MPIPHFSGSSRSTTPSRDAVSRRPFASDGRPIGFTSGARINQARVEIGQSLPILASDAGLPIADLVDIESGIRNPSLSELWKIAAGLGVPFARLLGPGHEALSVSRGMDAEVLLSSDGQLESRPLIASGACRWVEAYALTLAPGALHESDPHPRGTHEMIVVVSGVLVLRIGDRECELGPTDSMLFAADVAHAYVNPGTILGRYHNVIVYEK
jgi:transcriptional regulator with XRE-family HTH domain